MKAEAPAYTLFTLFSLQYQNTYSKGNHDYVRAVFFFSFQLQSSTLNSFKLRFVAFRSMHFFTEYLLKVTLQQNLKRQNAKI